MDKKICENCYKSDDCDNEILRSEGIACDEWGPKDSRIPGHPSYNFHAHYSNLIEEKDKEIEQLKHDFKFSQQLSMGKDQEVKWLKEKLDVLQTKYDHNLKADKIKEADKK